MAQFAVDSVALAEPNLLVPGKPPTGNVRIDTSNEFSRGLQLAFTGHDQIIPAIDIVSGVGAADLNPVTPVTVAEAPDGNLAIYIPNNGTTARSLVTPTIAHGIGTGPFTFTAWVLRLADTGQGYQGVLSNGSFAPGCYTEINGTTEWGVYWDGIVQAGEEWPVGTYGQMCVTRDSAGSTRLLRDGVLKATTAAFSGKSMSNDVFRIGATSTSGVNHSSVMIRDIRFYTRSFTNAEAMDACQDPYQFVTP